MEEYSTFVDPSKNQKQSRGRPVGDSKKIFGKFAKLRQNFEPSEKNPTDDTTKAFINAYVVDTIFSVKNHNQIPVELINSMKIVSMKKMNTYLKANQYRKIFFHFPKIIDFIQEKILAIND